MERIKAFGGLLESLDSAGLGELEEICSYERELAAALYEERVRILDRLGFGLPLAVSDLYFGHDLVSDLHETAKPRLVLSGGRSHYCLLIPGPSSEENKETWLPSSAWHKKSQLVHRSYEGTVFEIHPSGTSVDTDLVVHLAPPTELASKVRKLLKFWVGPRTFY